MNIIDEVEQFKRDLRSYDYRRKKIEQIEAELRYIAIKMQGVSSPNFSRIPGTPKVSQAKSESWYSLMDKEDKLVKRKADLEREIRFVDEVLDRMDEGDADIIRRLYIERETAEEIADTVYYSKRTIYNRVRSAIKSALNAMTS